MFKIVFEDFELEICCYVLFIFNFVVYNKFELIMGCFNQLIFYVMKEMVINFDFIREVILGFYKYKIDDGLEVCKVVYEMLYVFMEMVFLWIFIIDFYDCIIVGFFDEYDICVFCNFIVFKFVYFDLVEMICWLDFIVVVFRVMFLIKFKNMVVKQEIEKQVEVNWVVFCVILLFGDKFKLELVMVGGVVIGGYEVWISYWDWVNKDFNEQFKVVREEIKSLFWNIISVLFQVECVGGLGFGFWFWLGEEVVVVELVREVLGEVMIFCEVM